MSKKEKSKCWWKKTVFWNYVLRAIMIISLVLAFWKEDWVWVVGTFIGIFISFLPSILKRNIEVTLPWILDMFIALVTILHIFGRLLDAYYFIPGYLLMTRFFISALVALIGFSMIYILHIYWEGLRMDKYAMGFMTVIFTMTVGVILEFMKWLNISQRYTDITNNILMTNLLADTISGIIIAVIGVNLIKRGTFKKITEDFGKQIDQAFIHKKK